MPMNRRPARAKAMLQAESSEAAEGALSTPEHSRAMSEKAQVGAPVGTWGASGASRHLRVEKQQHQKCKVNVKENVHIIVRSQWPK